MTQRSDSSANTLTTPTPDEILASVRKATRRAVAFHRLIGNPVAGWENGQVVWVAPEDIPVTGDDTPPLDGKAI